MASSSSLTFDLLLPTVDDADILATYKSKIETSTTAAEKAFIRIDKEVKANQKNLPLPLSTQVTYKGNPNAKIMVIGIAPGQEEVDKGSPFVGPSGQLVQELLQSFLAKLPPSLRAPNVDNITDVLDHYIFTNAIFGKPEERRPPSPYEIHGYLPYLKRMIFAMKPKLIICLGNVPATIISAGCDLSTILNVPSAYKPSRDDPPITNFVKIQSIEGRCERVDINHEGSMLSTYMIPMSHPVGFLYNSELLSEKRVKWVSKLDAIYQKYFADNTNIEPLPPICQPKGFDIEDVKGEAGFNYDQSIYIQSVEDMISQIENNPVFSHILRRHPSTPEENDVTFSTRKFCGLIRNIDYDRKNNVLSTHLITPDGKTALINMTGYRYEFHVLPHPSLVDDNMSSRLNEEYLQCVERKLRKGLIYKYKKENVRTPAAYIRGSPDIRCQFSTGKKMMEKYEENAPTTILISVAHHDMIADLSDVIYTQWKWYAKKVNKSSPRPKIMNNIFSAPHMFNNCTGIAVSTWVRFAPGSIKFALPDNIYGLQYLGGCNISNVNSTLEGLDFTKPVPVDEAHYPGVMSDDHAQITRMSLDIECANARRKNPDANTDPVVTICNILHFQNGKCRYNTKNHALLENDMKTFYVERNATFYEKKIEVIQNLIKAVDSKEEDKIKQFNDDLVNTRRAYYRNVREGYYEVYFILGNSNTTIKNENTKKLFFQFAREDLLLMCQAIFMRSVGPNYLCGHNVKNFDLTYLAKRMRALNLPIDELGFDSSTYFSIKKRRFESRAFGERIITEVQGLNGCVILDTLEMYFREKKLRSYTLGAVAETFLEEKKDDMPYAAIWGYFIGTEDDRRILTDYCARDSKLVDQLINHGKWDSGLCEFARLNGAVPEGSLYSEGQQIVVLSAIMKQNFRESQRVLIVDPMCRDRYVKKMTKVNEQAEDDLFIDKFSDFWKQPGEVSKNSDKDYKDSNIEDVELDELMDIIKNMPGDIKVTQKPRLNAFSELMSSRKRNRTGADDATGPKRQKKADTKAAYQGATVLPPVTGCHIKPILTFDFSSLYPSIMIKFNICLSTILYESDFTPALDKSKFNCSPVKGINPRTGNLENVYFIKPEFYEGILRSTEIQLKNARNATRALQATYAEKIETAPKSDIWIPNPNYNPVKFAICDIRQLNIKKLMNSIYGATGTDGVLNSKDCAAGVTAYGRDGIVFVKNFLETEHNASIKGGDTDSVFAEFPDITTVEEAEARAEEIANAINKHFEEPMKIDYEKCYYPMILIAPKRYFGLKFTKGEGVKVEFKGLETIRRDSLAYVATLMKGVTMNILKKREAGESAEAYELRIRSYINQGVAKIREAGKNLLEGNVPTHMLVMSKQYSRHDYKALSQPHLFVREKMIARGEKPPELGERIPFLYVVLPHDPATGKERKGCELAEHPNYAIEHGLRINYKLYFEKKFIKPVMGIMKHFLRSKAAEAIIAKNTIRKLTFEDGEMKMTNQLKEGFNSIEKSLLENEIMDILFSPKNGTYLGVADNDGVKLNTEYSQLSKYIVVDKIPKLSSMPKEKRLVAIQKYRTQKQTAIEKRDACLKVCQDCTKSTVVLCGATDCESYFPRIESEKQLADIESLCSRLRIK